MRIVLLLLAIACIVLAARTPWPLGVRLAFLITAAIFLLGAVVWRRKPD
jgi:hypothetical protein